MSDDAALATGLPENEGYFASTLAFPPALIVGQETFTGPAVTTVETNSVARKRADFTASF